MLFEQPKRLNSDRTNFYARQLRLGFLDRPSKVVSDIIFVLKVHLRIVCSVNAWRSSSDILKTPVNSAMYIRDFRDI